MLSVLEFNFSRANAYTLLENFLEEEKRECKNKKLAYYLVNLSLESYEMLQFSPSEIAKACICIANCLGEDRSTLDCPQGGISIPLKYACEFGQCERLLYKFMKDDEEDLLKAYDNDLSSVKEFSEKVYKEVELYKLPPAVIKFHIVKTEEDKYTSWHPWT